MKAPIPNPPIRIQRDRTGFHAETAVFYVWNEEEEEVRSWITHLVPLPRPAPEPRPRTRARGKRRSGGGP